MAKQSQIEKAIAELEGQKQVLELAIQKLKEQQRTTPRKPKLRAVKSTAAVAGDQPA